VVLMSDGAPTYGTASFTNVTTGNRGGNGSSSDEDLAFVNQLTGAYTKYRIEQNYNKDALIYTLGVGISSDSIATSVLNPQNSVSDVLDLWETYDNLSSYGSMSISFPWSSEQTLSKNANVTSADRVYVDRYFAANSTSDISNAFQQIVDQIIIQSKYYPTYVTSGDHHLDGDITFDDDIGRYMEVKAIKGIVLGDTLFSGEALAHSIDIGHLGTPSNPTVLGNELVRSVQERINVDLATARELIDLAYATGQLFYDSPTGEYSNYIGWFSDADGNYLGFWNGDDNATAPAGAVFKNTSYGFIGASGTGTSASNMMYVAVQVHTRISTGTSQVIFRIPAALIPLITYEVSLEGTSYEDAKNIEVTKTMADPLRLVYEVGLKSEVNELTVKDVVASTYEHVNSEGIYSFYTNRWDHDQHIHKDHHPEEHINTVAFYTPSEQNERYYYTEDTLIYSAQNTDSVYTGASAPSGGTYYRAYYVFSNTAAKDGIKATFVEIHADALAQAKQNTDGSWYIPKGVILANRGNFFVDKTANPTGTYPFVKEPVVGGFDGVFYATSFLGNNGLLTLDPAQGIKITKTIETVEPNTNTEFTFTVKNLTDTGDNGEYRLIKQAADGTLSAEQSIFFTNGKATLTLNNGESAYIVDLVEGHTFSVEEAKHDDYRVKSVIVDGTAISDIFAEITVAKDTIAKAQFINTYIGKGLLVITKDVIHNLGADYEIPADIKFDVAVSLGIDNAGEEFDTVTETADGTVTNGKILADANGAFTLVIEDGMSIASDGIADGTAFTVIEADYSASGFITTANGVAGNSANGTIVADDNSHVVFVNTYDPEAADATVLIHNGTKTISGREWLDTDSFEFVVERFDGNNYVEVARVATTYADATNGTAPFSFNNYFTTAVFDTVGTHSFRISEVLGTIGGVTYSTALYDVTVTVTDTDMDGKLEIADVTSATATINHSRNNGTWEIVTPFENTYRASGGATVEISIAKTIDDLTRQAQNLSLQGYQFGLYNAYGTLLETLTTDANGLAVIARTYTATDIGKVFNYTIREIDTGVTGIKYSNAVHTVSIEIVDNLDGTIGATVTGATNESTQEATFAVSYENVYEPAKTSITLSGSKTLTGIRDMVAGEFTFSVTENGT
ncbi:MAG: hypothetical protein IJX54_00410, partial [Oscillospiraceae bacterium]|nr:hypothetical protein [Oscillospiraceae bacterium]